MKELTIRFIITRRFRESNNNKIHLNELCVLFKSNYQRNNFQGREMYWQFKIPDIYLINIPVYYEVELKRKLRGLIGRTSHPDLQKIGIIGFFIKHKLQWQTKGRLLLFTVCTCV